MIFFRVALDQSWDIFLSGSSWRSLKGLLGKIYILRGLNLRDLYLVIYSWSSFCTLRDKSSFRIKSIFLSREEGKITRFTSIFCTNYPYKLHLTCIHEQNNSLIINFSTVLASFSFLSIDGRQFYRRCTTCSSRFLIFAFYLPLCLSLSIWKKISENRVYIKIEWK